MNNPANRSANSPRLGLARTALFSLPLHAYLKNSNRQVEQQTSLLLYFGQHRALSSPPPAVFRQASDTLSVSILLQFPKCRSLLTQRSRVSCQINPTIRSHNGFAHHTEAVLAPVPGKPVTVLINSFQCFRHKSISVLACVYPASRRAMPIVNIANNTLYRWLVPRD